jgi:hypothetical protein
MAKIARDIILEAAAVRLMIKAVHVQRESNQVADALSRFDSPLNSATMAPGEMQRAVQRLGGPMPLQDIFADDRNAQVRNHLEWVRRGSDGQADALVSLWAETVWAFPPPALVLLALNRFIEQPQCQTMFLVVPEWHAQPIIPAIETAIEFQWERVSLPASSVVVSDEVSSAKVARWSCYKLSKISQRKLGRSSLVEG